MDAGASVDDGAIGRAGTDICKNPSVYGKKKSWKDVNVISVVLLGSGFYGRWFLRLLTFPNDPCILERGNLFYCHF